MWVSEYENFTIISRKIFNLKNIFTFFSDVVHDKKMKFKCDHCGKEFGNGNNYRTHVKVVHEGFKGYECHYCNKYLRTQGALKKHLQSEHNE